LHAYVGNAPVARRDAYGLAPDDWQDPGSGIDGTAVGELRGAGGADRLRTVRLNGVSFTVAAGKLSGYSVGGDTRVDGCSRVNCLNTAVGAINVIRGVRRVVIGTINSIFGVGMIIVGPTTGVLVEGEEVFAVVDLASGVWDLIGGALLIRRGVRQM